MNDKYYIGLSPKKINRKKEMDRINQTSTMIPCLHETREISR